MSEDTVLIIDDDPPADGELRSRLLQAGLSVELVNEGLVAMEKLAQSPYCAVVLDPMIRHRLNGYTVLSYIEFEHPGVLNRLFVFTGMSRQTIERTAPMLVPRFFRKPLEAQTLATVILAEFGPTPTARISRSALLVEDDAATAAATAQLLEQFGYFVARVSSGTEALSALASADFDVIILDLIMPDVDGFMVLDRLQSSKPHLLRRVIVTTGVPERYAKGIDQSGVYSVIRKPINAPDLVGALRDLAPRSAAEPRFRPAP